MAHEDGHPQRHHTSPNVSWFELFYDLVVIAAVALSNDVFLENPSLTDAVLAAFAFIALAWVWFLTTLFNNMHPGQDLVRRVVMLVQMGLIITAALTFSQAGENRTHVSLLAYGGVLLTIPLLMLNDRFVSRGRRPAIPWRETYVGPLLLAALVCAAGALIPGSAARWALVPALLLSIVPMLTWKFRLWRDDPRLRPEHLRERLGLFVLIVLGEGFADLVAALHEMGGVPRGGLFVMTFIVSFALWWVYFEGTFTEELDLGIVRWRLTLLGHLTLVLSMAGTLDILVLLTVQEEEELGDLVMEYFSWCVAGVLLSFALLRFAAHRRLGVPGILHLVTAVLVVAIGMTLGEGGMSEFHLVVGLCAAAIIGNGVAAAWLDRPGGTARERLDDLVGDSLEG